MKARYLFLVLASVGGCCATSATPPGDAGASPVACGPCEDGNPCTTDSCEAGACVTAKRNDGVACDTDGGRMCIDGACTWGCVSDAECDDGNAATVDSCLGWRCAHADGRIKYTTCSGKADGVVCADVHGMRGVCWRNTCVCDDAADCDDGDAFTADACVAHTCQNDTIP